MGGIIAYERSLLDKLWMDRKYLTNNQNHKKVKYNKLVFIILLINIIILTYTYNIHNYIHTKIYPRKTSIHALRFSHVKK